MVENAEYIRNKLKKMTIEQARHAIANGQFGDPKTQSYAFASDLLSAREGNLRDTRESETLTISRNALQASEDANNLASDANSIARKARSDARWANIIAIIATAIAIAAIIIPLLTKK